MPRLLAVADLPSTSKRFRYFGVGNDSTGVSIREPLLDRPNDVQVVKDVVEAAIVGQAIQKVSNLLLGFHIAHLDSRQRLYAMSGAEPANAEAGMGQRAKATSANISAVSQAIEYSIVRRAQAPSTGPVTPRRANSRKPAPSSAATAV